MITPDNLFWWLAGVVFLLLITHILDRIWQRRRLYP